MPQCGLILSLLLCAASSNAAATVVTYSSQELGSNEESLVAPSFVRPAEPSSLSSEGEELKERIGKVGERLNAMDERVINFQKDMQQRLDQLEKKLETTIENLASDRLLARHTFLRRPLFGRDESDYLRTLNTTEEPPEAVATNASALNSTVSAVWQTVRSGADLTRLLGNLTSAGKDLSPPDLFVCRKAPGLNRDNAIPGKAKLEPGKGDEIKACCYIPSMGREEKFCDGFQLLTEGHELNWVKAPMETIPEGAVEGGRTPSGSKLFIGRCKHEFNGLVATVIGKVSQVDPDKMVYPFGGKQHTCTDFEILVGPIEF